MINRRWKEKRVENNIINADEKLGGSFSFPLALYSLKSFLDITLTSYSPRSLVSTGLSATYSREERPSPPQTRGWLGTLHACDIAHLETLEQLFKKPSLKQWSQRWSLGLLGGERLKDPSPQLWEECCSFRCVSSGSFLTGSLWGKVCAAQKHLDTSALGLGYTLAPNQPRGQPGDVCGFCLLEWRRKNDFTWGEVSL